MKKAAILLFFTILSSSISGCITENDNGTNFVLERNLDFIPGDFFDLDEMQKIAEEEIKKEYPEAIFISYVFTGTCKNLREGKGIISIEYVEIKKIFYQLNPRVIEITVSFDTIQKKSKMTIIDMTDSITEVQASPIIRNSQYQRLLYTIDEKMRNLLLDDCNIEIWQKGSTWRVAYYLKDSNENPYRFEIRDFQ